jgi:hypothetical protein
MQSYDAFTLMIPCAAITRPKVPLDSYSVALDISRTKWELTLLKTDGTMPTRFRPDMNEYTEFRVERLRSCLFTGPRTAPFALFFLSARANLRRLTYTLADAGLLVPKSPRDATFRLLPRPSFIPTGEFAAHGSILLRCIEESLKTRAISVTPENLPFFSGFSGALESAFLDQFDRATVRFSENEGRTLVNMDVNRHILLDWLLVVAPPMGTFRAHRHQRANPGQAEPLVDVDSLRHPPHKLCDREELKTICADIARIADLSGHRYVQGNLHIVQRIVVLIAGDSGLPGDTSQDPDWLVQVHRDEFAFSAYFFLTELFNVTGPQPISTILKRIAPVILELLEKGFPQFIPFLHQYLAGLPFVQQDLPHMFAASTKEIWRMWYWMFRQSNLVRAYAAVTLGFLLAVVKDHCHKAQREPETIRDAWPYMVVHADSMEALRFAVYLLLKADHDAPQPLRTTGA